MGAPLWVWVPFGMALAPFGDVGGASTHYVHSIAIGDKQVKQWALVSMDGAHRTVRLGSTTLASISIVTRLFLLLGNERGAGLSAFKRGPRFELYRRENNKTQGSAQHPQAHDKPSKQPRFY